MIESPGSLLSTTGPRLRAQKGRPEEKEAGRWFGGVNSVHFFSLPPASSSPAVFLLPGTLARNPFIVRRGIVWFTSTNTMRFVPAHQTSTQSESTIIQAPPNSPHVPTSPPTRAAGRRVSRGGSQRSLRRGTGRCGSRGGEESVKLRRPKRR